LGIFLAGVLATGFAGFLTTLAFKLANALALRLTGLALLLTGELA